MDKTIWRSSSRIAVVNESYCDEGEQSWKSINFISLPRLGREGMVRSTLHVNRTQERFVHWRKCGNGHYTRWTRWTERCLPYILHTININHRFATSWSSEIFLRLPRHHGWFDCSTLFKTPNLCIWPWSMFQEEISGRSSIMLVSFTRLILNFMSARCSPVSMSSISLDTSIVTSSLRYAWSLSSCYHLID